MSEKTGIFLHGLAVFVVTLGLAVLAARVVGAQGGYAPDDFIAVPYFLALFLIATLGLILVLKLSKTGWPLQILFVLAVLLGAVALFDVFLPPPWGFLAGALAALMYYRRHSVLTANLGLALALSGLAGVVASGLRPTAVVVIFTVLAFYDIVAVYVTGHMVRMFRGLSERGVQMAFVLVPPFAKASGDKSPLMKAPGDGTIGKAFYLGTGDVALPAILAASAVRQGLIHGLAAALGALVGYVLLIWLFFGQGRRRPMPALPPIAFGCIGFYLISLLIWP
jgi:presenilin-like A22 family membrane protease